jgi:hypothetical protein
LLQVHEAREELPDHERTGQRAEEREESQRDRLRVHRAVHSNREVALHDHAVDTERVESLQEARVIGARRETHQSLVASLREEREVVLDRKQRRRRVDQVTPRSLDLWRELTRRRLDPDDGQRVVGQQSQHVGPRREQRGDLFGIGVRWSIAEHVGVEYADVVADVDAVLVREREAHDCFGGIARIGPPSLEELEAVDRRTDPPVRRHDHTDARAVADEEERPRRRGLRDTGQSCDGFGIDRAAGRAEETR